MRLCAACAPLRAPLRRLRLPGRAAPARPPPTQRSTVPLQASASMPSSGGGVGTPAVAAPLNPELARAQEALVAATARGRAAPGLQTRPPPPGRQGGTPPQLQGLEVEDVEVKADDSPQGWVPLRCARDPAGAAPGGRLPAVVLVHATGVERGSLAEAQGRLARRGFLAVALDCRYHGVRNGRAGEGVSDREAYEDALVGAWEGSGERPFLLDNAWDVSRVVDYLISRPDVDAARIGATGVSMGGMITWFAAAADARLAAVAPMIGVQHFGRALQLGQWALRHRRHHARVQSIPRVFEAAAAALGQEPDARAIEPATAMAVWRVLVPGLAEAYDAPELLALLAPRPALVAGGEDDPRCPMQGVRIALDQARGAYAAAGAPAHALRLFAEHGVGHEATPAMWREVDAFLEGNLLPK